jgi:hypothetical protein
LAFPIWLSGAYPVPRQGPMRHLAPPCTSPRRLRSKPDQGWPSRASAKTSASRRGDSGDSGLARAAIQPAARGRRCRYTSGRWAWRLRIQRAVTARKEQLYQAAVRTDSTSDQAGWPDGSGVATSAESDRPSWPNGPFVTHGYSRLTSWAGCSTLHDRALQHALLPGRLPAVCPQPPRDPAPCADRCGQRRGPPRRARPFRPREAARLATGHVTHAPGPAPSSSSAGASACTPCAAGTYGGSSGALRCARLLRHHRLPGRPHRLPAHCHAMRRRRTPSARHLCRLPPPASPPPPPSPLPHPHWPPHWSLRARAQRVWQAMRGAGMLPQCTHAHALLHGAARSWLKV